MNGDAVMYDVGKILTVGGATAYKNTPATARAYTIDINNGATAARTADMAVSRSFANGVALPDGQVLVVGGQAIPVPVHRHGCQDGSGNLEPGDRTVDHDGSDGHSPDLSQRGRCCSRMPGYSSAAAGCARGTAPPTTWTERSSRRRTC